VSVGYTQQNSIKGKLIHFEDFNSAIVNNFKIDVWLPTDHGTDSLSVLYMHDGQMLFDSTQTWNKQAWDVDDILFDLIKAGKVKPCIIVAIHNRGSNRHADYFPSKPYESLSSVQKDSIQAQLIRSGKSKGNFTPASDNYLKFIVEELKPYIDKSFKVYTDKTHTFISGSSMGGLISLYAMCEYPEVFGGAACLSTHWTGSFIADNNPFPDAMLSYLKEKLPDPSSHLLYMDCGNKTLDTLYPAIQLKADKIISRKGYRYSSSRTYYYPKADHTERAWKSRLIVPLMFLLKP